MTPTVTIAVLGDRDPTHRTHREPDAALRHLPPGVSARWVASDSAQARASEGFDAIWVAPGTPHRDPGAVLGALRAARTGGQPLLATCGGFQAACVEIARTELGLTAANAETDQAAADPLIAPLACGLVGEWRMVSPVAGTRLASILGAAPFAGFHWCRYGVAPRFEAALESAGVVVAARSADAGIEAIELPGHPFFVATLFQPQIGAAERRALPALVAARVAAARRPTVGST
jgi:CTP synthase (UTP-ammonia lyase)